MVAQAVERMVVAIRAIDCLFAMREPVTAYIGLGANLGDPAATLALAVQQLGSLPENTVMAQSSLYRTAPVDAVGPDFTNAVIAVQTKLTAPALLACLQSIEASAGRQRPYRNAPRTLDLDILLFGGASVSSATLSIPHPRMWGRAFVLMPLAELAPQLVSVVQLRAVEMQRIVKIF